MRQWDSTYPNPALVLEWVISYHSHPSLLSTRQNPRPWGFERGIHSMRMWHPRSWDFFTNSISFHCGGSTACQCFDSTSRRRPVRIGWGSASWDIEDLSFRVWGPVPEYYPQICDLQTCQIVQPVWFEGWAFVFHDNKFRLIPWVSWCLLAKTAFANICEGGAWCHFGSGVHCYGFRWPSNHSDKSSSFSRIGDRAKRSHHCRGLGVWHISTWC